MSMNAVSRMFNRVISMVTLSTTSSLASVDGPTRSDSPDGLTRVPSGLAPVHVSRSAPLDEAKALTMRAISGPSGSGSSASASLQSSLENRLRVRLVDSGSALFALTWKHWAMPWGVPICALRASGRHTSGSGCGSWPTPNVANAHRAGFSDMQKLQNRIDSGKQQNLQEIVKMVAPWTTPTVRDWKDTGDLSRSMVRQDGKARNDTNARLAFGAGWATPKVTANGVTQTGFWSDADWLPCLDGKARPVEPGTFPLAHGAPARVGRLRGYGNAIVPQVAQAFIEAYLDIRDGVTA
jgi:hypothetical protein